MTPKEELIAAIAQAPEETVQVLLKVLKTLEPQQFLQTAQSSQQEESDPEQVISREHLQTRTQWLSHIRQFRMSQPLGEPLSATIVKARQEERY